MIGAGRGRQDVPNRNTGARPPGLSPSARRGGRRPGRAGLWAPAPALARAASRVRAVEASDIGVTLKIELSNAPFPCDGAPYQDATAMVFVPAHYRAPESDELDLVIHFHGHVTTAERAIAAHKLREQLHESKQNAVLVVPQCAVNAAESPPGKLGQKGGLRRLCGELASVLAGPSARRALGDCAIPRQARLGTLCLSAHSGGYRVAAACLRHGGCEVNEVYLFDALYGEVDAFRDWVLERKGERGGTGTSSSATSSRATCGGSTLSRARARGAGRRLPSRAPPGRAHAQAAPGRPRHLHPGPARAQRGDLRAERVPRLPVRVGPPPAAPIQLVQEEGRAAPD